MGDEKRFSASGQSFSIHEWRGSGPAGLHVHHADDEAWHVLEGELTFRYADRVEVVGRGTTVFVPAATGSCRGRSSSCRLAVSLQRESWTNSPRKR
jgi:quercetin dioxygenase-like cupin family protein